MSIYIAVYVFISLALIIFLNYTVVKRKRRIEREKRRQPYLDEDSSLSDNKLNNDVNDMLESSAIPEPALEFVEAKINIKDKRKEETKQSRRGKSKENDKNGGNGKILAALLLGAFVAILNQTLLNVAIPHIMTDLNISANTVQWLSTGYMLVNGIFIPVTAYLIEKFGTRKLFFTSVLLFTVGSVICSFATNFGVLMTGRVVQASGAGIIMPLMMTVFFTIFPPEKRGTAMGIMGIVMLFAPAIGPTLSGWIVEHYSWRLLFDVVIPIGIIDLVITYLWMRDVTEITNPKFDFPGVLFSTLGFGFLLYGFSEAGNDGWTSSTVIISLIIGILSLIAFTWRELTTDKPMLELRVFKYDIFALTTIISMIINIAMFGAMILLPIYLQNIRGFTAFESGLMLLPGAIIMGIMSPIAGAIFDKIGARWLAVVGLTITVITTWQFSHLSMTTTYSHILVLYVLRMFGMSFLMMTVMTEGLNQLPRHLAAHGTAASNTARQVAGSIGTAFLVTVMSTRRDVHAGEYMNAVTSTNPFLSSKLNEIGHGIAGLAHIPVAAGNQLATFSLYGQTMKQATVEGLNDSFIVATGIAFVALILAFFIKRAKLKNE
ncbi:DHA2 family efflux MFS transporter permease subunit [Neobacillus sp. PS3-34]|uniref:DHA2 family efflux MFS transporter permease subunit n=1 Tax=Neobacillus sp. PS3-34 TaxID=3070678 RepID=UPI0027DECAE1|nr:DHA2 family efflux MFS transporter permease subunit [Neobacillus sp. PS3-34]WML47961.1 DHA2 family efflux MFS transporter permease subunit [Neobacillus sp. PS3-34]